MKTEDYFKFLVGQAIKGKQKVKKVIAEIKMWGMETKWQRLGDIARGTETVWWGLEVILQI